MSADPWRTFSGAHAYREACLRMAMELEFGGPLDNAGDTNFRHLDELIGEFLCPRCEQPVNPDALAAYEAAAADTAAPHPSYDPGRHQPAGSRATLCRCIPVCDLCGDHEPFVTLAPYYWPLSADVIAEQMGKAGRLATEGILSVSGGTAVVVTPDGVTELHPAPRPVAGWSSDTTRPDPGRARAPPVSPGKEDRRGLVRPREGCPASGRPERSDGAGLRVGGDLAGAGAGLHPADGEVHDADAGRGGMAATAALPPWPSTLPAYPGEAQSWIWTAPPEQRSG